MAAPRARPTRAGAPPPVRAAPTGPGSAEPSSADPPSTHWHDGWWSWLPSVLSVLTMLGVVCWQLRSGGGTVAPAAAGASTSSALQALQGSCPGRTVPKGDMYQVLGVRRDFDSAALRAAYRRLALAWHPDKNADCASASAIMAELSRAHAVLSTPELRDVYDRLGDAGLQRLADGDPSVAQGWLPPDEVLRRHGLGDVARRWNSLDDIVVNLFSFLEGR